MRSINLSKLNHRNTGKFNTTTAKIHPVFAFKTIAICLMVSFAANSFALPVGGTVAAGTSSISSGTNNVTITQSTQNTVINWQSFNIGQSESVNFVQPNSWSVALNRVVGADPSNILGNLSANGKVFLVNPNGILFGKGAQVNVGGLVASTLNITDTDFMSGNYVFSGTGNGTVLNQATINTNADGGYVALLGANVGNDGIIAAKLGTVILAAGNAITLDVVGDGLLNVTVNQGAVNALVQNSGLIQADGGLVLLTAQSAGNLLLTVVNNSGVIQAQSIQNINGTIKLLADMQSGTVIVGGTLDASGSGTGQTGGNVTVTGQQVGLFSGHINISGDSGGGTAFIGGDLHGANIAIPNASASYVSADSTINADAVTKGNGGKVIVWANDINRYYGNISARGGVQGGDGGFTEVSGKNNLMFTGYVDLRAPSGRTGTLLLDPYNLTIQAAGPDVAGNSTGLDLNSALSTPNIFFADYGVLNSIITTGQVVTQLNTANVTLQATHDITVAAAIDASANTVGKVLTLQAGHDVIINAALTTAGVGGGTINLVAGNNVTVGAAITDAGGAVTLSAGNNGSGSGTVAFAAVTAADLTIRFNPVSYTTTSAEIAVYAPKATLTGTFDARAWTFVNNASASALSKTYDGTTVAMLNNPFTFLNGPDGSTAGQIVSLNAGSANFNSAHVAIASTVNFTGYTLSGSDSLNYALFAQPTGQSKNITPAQLTAAATITGAAKTYDGILAAIGSTVNGSTSGEIGSDTVLLDTSALSLNFSDAHVVGSKTIGTTGNVALGTLTSSGSGNLSGSSTTNRVVSVASDYVLAAQPVIASVVGTITAASLTAAAAISGASKTYDGLLAATGSTVSGSTSGEVGTDTVLLDTSGINLNFSNAHVAPAKTIVASGSVALGTLTSSGSGNLSGSSTTNRVVSVASDYVLAAQPVIASVVGTITAASLTAAAAISGASKTYDGLLAATGSTVSGSTSGEVGTDTVLLDTSGINLNFSNAHVAPAKTIVASGSVALGTLTSSGSGNLSGSSTTNRVVSVASDYVLAAQPVITSVVGTITAAALNFSGTHVYDGTLNFAANTIGTSGMITTGIGLENLVLTGTGSVPLKGVAAGNQTLNTAGLTLTNGTGLASDYTFSGGTHTAAITPKPLNISGITAANKVYDGTTSATINTAGTIYSGIISGDAVTVNATGVFANKNVATGKIVTLTSLYSGVDVSNYSIASQANTTANITAVPVVTVTPPTVTPVPFAVTTTPLTVSVAPLNLKALTQPLTELFVPLTPIFSNVAATDFELNWLPTKQVVAMTDQSYERQSSKKSGTGRYNTWHGSTQAKADIKSGISPALKATNAVIALADKDPVLSKEPSKEDQSFVNLTIVGSPLDGGKFAKLKIGMTMKQVEELIGAPDWSWQQFTGEESTPYYTGTDRQLVQYTYKSEGMLTFSSSQEPMLIRMLVNRAG